MPDKELIELLELEIVTECGQTYRISGCRKDLESQVALAWTKSRDVGEPCFFCGSNVENEDVVIGISRNQLVGTMLIDRHLVRA